MDIEQVTEDIFRVHSDTSTKVYVVDLTVPNCTCPNWAIQRNKLVGQARAKGQNVQNVKYLCKHISYAKAHARNTTTPAQPRVDFEKQKLERQKQEILNKYRKPKKKAELLGLLAELSKDDG